MLDPEEWPPVIDPASFGHMEFQKLADSFGYVNLLGEWKELLENIVEAPEFCRMRKVPARDFWGHFMYVVYLMISSNYLANYLSFQWAALMPKERSVL